MATEVVLQSPAGEGVRVLAKVGDLDEATLDALRPYEGDEPYFPDYVDVSIPHDDAYSETIVDSTQGHALADESGGIIARFEGEKNGMTSLERAEKARTSMRRVVTVEFDGAEDEAQVPETQSAEPRQFPEPQASQADAQE